MTMRHVLINKAKTYILLIEVLKGLDVFVGRLKDLHFKKGFYLYIGSAKKAFRARIQRHLARTKNIFWHIDYLLSSNDAKIKQIWTINKDKECKIAQFLCKKGYSFINRFGSSDYNCHSHLFFINKGARETQGLLKKRGFIKYADKNYCSWLN